MEIQLIMHGVKYFILILLLVSLMILRNVLFMIIITQITKQLKIKLTHNKIIHLNKIKQILTNHLIQTRRIKTNHLIQAKQIQTNHQIRTKQTKINHLILTKHNLIIQTKPITAVKKTITTMTLSFTRVTIQLIHQI